MAQGRAPEQIVAAHATEGRSPDPSVPVPARRRLQGAGEPGRASSFPPGRMMKDEARIQYSFGGAMWGRSSRRPAFVWDPHGRIFDEQAVRGTRSDVASRRRHSTYD